MNDSDNNRNEYQNINTLENYQNKNMNENENANDITKIDNEIPSTLLMCRKIQNQESLIPIKILFDSGGSSTMIHERCLPPGAVPSLLSSGKSKFQTVAGTFESSREVYLEDITLPEFDKTR